MIRFIVELDMIFYLGCQIIQLQQPDLDFYANRTFLLKLITNAKFAHFYSITNPYKAYLIDIDEFIDKDLPTPIDDLKDTASIIDCANNFKYRSLIQEFDESPDPLITKKH